MISVTYIFHDCFLIETPDCSLLFDFWKDPLADSECAPEFLTLLPDNKPLYIFVSHHHKDHFNRVIFNWAETRPNLRYIISYDTWRMARHFIAEGSSYKGFKPKQDSICVLKPGHEASFPHIKINAFGSTDTGCSWLITTSNQQKIFHAGDLNAWIWKDESTEKEVESAINDFRDCLKPISRLTTHIDIAMFPVDSRIGTDYWTGAGIFVRIFEVDRFFPMHFELGTSAEEINRLHRDAAKFFEYANRDHGEYVALLSPFSCAFFSNDDL